MCLTVLKGVERQHAEASDSGCKGRFIVGLSRRKNKTRQKGGGVEKENGPGGFRKGGDFMGAVMSVVSVIGHWRGWKLHKPEGGIRELGVLLV